MLTLDETKRALSLLNVPFVESGGVLEVTDGHEMPTEAAMQAALDEDPVVNYVPFPIARDRAEAAGIWPALATTIDALPADKRLKLFSLTLGIADNDTEVRTAITAAGGDPDVILAPLG